MGLRRNHPTPKSRLAEHSKTMNSVLVLGDKTSGCVCVCLMIVSYTARQAQHETEVSQETEPGRSDIG